MKLTVVTGLSGTGKSTTLRTIKKLDERVVTLDDLLVNIPGYEYGDNVAIALTGGWDVKHIDMNDEWVIAIKDFSGEEN